MISLDYSDSYVHVKAGFHCCSLSWWSLFYFLVFYRTVINDCFHSGFNADYFLCLLIVCFDFYQLS